MIESVPADSDCNATRPVPHRPSAASPLRAPAEACVLKTEIPLAVLDALRAQAQEAAAYIDAQFAAVRAAADRTKLLIIQGVSAIALSTVVADAAHKAIRISIDPESARKIRSAIDRVDALADRDPEAADVLMDMPLSDAYHLLRYIPAPARRPKGVK